MIEPVPPERVKVYVEHQLREMAIVITEHRPVAVLKQMSGALVLPVEVHRITGQEVFA